MSSKPRNHLFSIAHPLGGTSPTSSTSSLTSEQPYVPYTPRQQRLTHAYPPQDATTRLQLINLKLAAQNIGLEPIAVGWAILERLVSEADNPSQWTDIRHALAIGKATLLLPSEPTSAQVHVTPDFVKDHVAFIESPATTGKEIQLVTLSGLRGVLRESGLTFRSTLHPTSKLHRALIHPSTRASTFSHLPPLPKPYHLHLQRRTSEPNDQVSSPTVPYPTFIVSPLTPPTQPPIIPIQTRTPIPPKPPLPPRPSSAATATQPTPVSSHRLPNPFASLFGGGPPPSTTTTTTTTTTAAAAAATVGGGGGLAKSTIAPPSANTSPATYSISLPPEHTTSGSTSVQQLQQQQHDVGSGSGSGSGSGANSLELRVSVLVIDRKVVRKELAREINNGVMAEMAHALTSRTTTGDGNKDEGDDDDDDDDGYDIPEWVGERVNEFVSGMGLYPFVPREKDIGGGRGQMKLSKRLEVAIAGRRALGRQRSDEHGEGDGELEYVIGTWSEAPEDVSVTIQDFFIELEREVRLRQEKVVERRKERESSVEKSCENDEKEKDGNEKEENEADKLVKCVIEAVEAVLSSLFYDRLFIQPISDDASHDEALASRVAALNMVDLTLEHLDIDVGEAGEELELVVKACGETLMQLETCRSPSDKAAVLVGAHKVVVDGLTMLPPIKLIPEEESRANRSKQGKSTQPPPQGGELKEMQISVRNDGHDRTSEGDPSSTSMPSIPAIVEPINGEEPTQQDEKLAKGTKKPPPPLPLGSPPPETATAAYPKQPKQHTLATSDSSQQPKSTPVSGDVLLPIIIFSVVKSNPPHLVSHLLFTQRFRNHVVPGSGEESYCLINLMAVAEFLENVDLVALGLDRPLPSAAELTPIPIVRSPAAVVGAGVGVGGREGQLGEKRFGEGGLGTFRGKVEQQVDAIAGSANKVLAGVMDTSFGMLRSLLPGQGQGQGQLGLSSNAGQMGVDPQAQPQATPLSPGAGSGSGSEPWNVVKPGFGLLKRESGFSIASIAASLPISRTNMSKSGEEDGQQMITVSRPVSVRSSRTGQQRSDGEESDEEGVDARDIEEGTIGGGEEDVTSGEDGEDATGQRSHFHNGMRSIRSFESMMHERSGKGQKALSGRLAKDDQKNHGSPAGGVNASRKSLSDRLAHMSALAGIKHGELMPPSARSNTPPSRPSTPLGSPLRVAPPVQRFLECSPDDLRIAEVADLLREYRRLAEAIRLIGGYSDDV